MKLANMTWQDTVRASGATALLPLGATEQHGPHLAVSTDAAIVTAIAEHVERTLPESVVLCPTVPFGSSHHHLSFGGTLSIRPGLYTSMIIDLVQSLLSGGFRRIVLFNGHGGNITPVRQALSEVSANGKKTEPQWIVLATYWELAGNAFAGAKPMESPALSHACEYETSLMLHLYPERVRVKEIQRSGRPVDTAYIRWEDDTSYRGVSAAMRTELLSSNGSSGEPQLANSRKGEHLFNHAVSALREFVIDFQTWPELRDCRNL
jgi:creatinine amidohydrolase